MKGIVYLILLFSYNTFAQDLYKLNSFPGAQATILIDFDGQTVDSRFWKPFYKDSLLFCSPSGLSDIQKIRIFNHVSEDFRPFNITVTTDSTVFFRTSLFRRVRVIVTTTSAWYNGSGGTAYIESFRWGEDVPCFVFPDILRFFEKRVAEAVSHEVGHTLGLYHQARYNDTCRFLDEYNPGVGTGQTSWAPIMGNPYFRNITTWHNGRNSIGCSRFQDDLAIITGSLNGFGYRPDDYTENLDLSQNVQFQIDTLTIDGIIGRTDDADVFNFDLPQYGNLIVNARPFSVVYEPNSLNSNIDTKLDLFDKDKKLIGSYNNILLVSSNIDTFLNAGRYYLRISNTDNPFALRYGMLGSYTIGAKFTPYLVLSNKNIRLNGNYNSSYNYIFWDINIDDAVKSVNLQNSTNGVDWDDILTGDGELRFYKHVTDAEQTFYKLKVKLESGDIQYSNIVKVNRFVYKKPYNFLVFGDNISLDVIKDAEWRIVDIQGKVYKYGKAAIGSNIINLALPSGVYLFQMYINGMSFSEKFMQ